LNFIRRFIAETRFEDSSNEVEMAKISVLDLLGPNLLGPSIKSQ
jgi:hypothetical protein